VTGTGRWGGGHGVNGGELACCVQAIRGRPRSPPAGERRRSSRRPPGRSRLLLALPGVHERSAPDRPGARLAQECGRCGGGCATGSEIVLASCCRLPFGLRPTLEEKSAEWRRQRVLHRQQASDSLIDHLPPSNVVDHFAWLGHRARRRRTAGIGFYATSATRTKPDHAEIAIAVPRGHRVRIGTLWSCGHGVPRPQRGNHHGSSHRAGDTTRCAPC